MIFERHPDYKYIYSKYTGSGLYWGYNSINGIATIRDIPGVSKITILKY